MAGAAESLKVLIQILTDGNAVKSVIGDVKGLKQALDSVGGAKVGGAVPDIEKLDKAARKAADGMASLESAISSVQRGLKFLAGGFLALESVRFFKDLADNAARTQVLGTVLHVVGQNAGYSTQELDKTDKAIQRMGITAASSRQSLTQLLQAGLKISFAAQLARASQDLAVISGMNSSDTFQRLITNIQQLDALGLRWMGIIVNREEAERKYQREVIKTTRELSNREKQEALLREVLVKAKDLEGTYAAAMGDVGKQLTSLERFSKTLKDELGEGLLPAYLAIIGELTQFYKYLINAAQAMNANRDGAQALGDGLRSVLSSLRGLAQFVVDHYGFISRVVKLYVEWRIALLAIRGISMVGSGMVAFITWLGTARLALTALVTAGGGFKLAAAIMEAGSFTAARALLATRAAAVVAASGAVGATGAVTGLGVALGALELVGIIGALVLMGLALKTIWDNLAGANKAWQEGHLWQSVKSRIESNVRRSQNFFTEEAAIGSGPEEYLNKADEVARRRKALDTQQQVTYEAEIASIKARGPMGTQADIDKTNEVTKREKEKEQALQEQFDVILEGLSSEDPKRAEMERAFLKKKKEFNRLKILNEEIAQAEQTLFGGKKAFGEGGEVQGANFSKVIGAMNKEIQAFDELAQAPRDAAGALLSNGREFTEANREMMNRLREGLKITAPVAETALDLKQLAATVAEFKKRATSKADFSLADSVLGVARLRVEEAEKAFRAPLVARAKENQQNKAARETEEFQQSQALQKQANDAAEASEKDKFSRGLLGIDEYYQARNQRIVEEGAAEEALIRSQITGLEGRRALAQTSPEREGIQNQIRAAQNKLELRGRQTGLELQRSNIEAENEEFRALSRVAQIHEQTAGFYGGEQAALEAINRKYVELERTTVRTATSQKELTDAKALEVFQTRIEYANRALEVQLSLQRSLLTVKQAALDASVSVGAITEVESLRRGNALIREEIELKRMEITGKQTALRVLEDERRLKEAIMVEDFLRVQAAQALGETASVNTQLITDLEGINQEIAKGSIGIMTLGSELEMLSVKFDTYGKRLQQVFTESLASAISTSVTDFRNAGNAFISMGESLKRQIGDTIGKNLSEKITQSILARSTKTSEPDYGTYGSEWGYDAEGKEVGKTGRRTSTIFDSIFDFMGLQSDTGEKPGTSWANPLYTKTRIETGGSITLPGGDQIPLGGITGGSDLGGLKNLFSTAASFSQGGVSGGLANAVPQLMKMFRGLFGGGATVGLGGSGFGFGSGLGWSAGPFAGGGMVNGVGTGTSDSNLAMVSTGEYITPAAQTRRFLPLLEAMRSGNLMHFAFGGLVNDSLQSIAPTPLIARHYAGGGVVTSDAGAASVIPGGGGPGAIMVTLHPEAMKMTMKDWFEGEVVRQHGRR